MGTGVSPKRIDTENVCVTDVSAQDSLLAVRACTQTDNEDGLYKRRSRDSELS